MKCPLGCVCCPDLQVSKWKMFFSVGNLLKTNPKNICFQLLPLLHTWHFYKNNPHCKLYGTLKIQQVFSCKFFYLKQSSLKHILPVLKRFEKSLCRHFLVFCSFLYFQEQSPRLSSKFFLNLKNVFCDDYYIHKNLQLKTWRLNK